MQSAKSIFNFPFSIFNCFPGVILSVAKDLEEENAKLIFNKKAYGTSPYAFLAMFVAYKDSFFGGIRTP